MERDGYYPSSSGPPLGAPTYQNEQPTTAAPYAYYGAPQPDMQQCYPPQPAGYFPNDPHYTWTQQNHAWMDQMMRHQQQQQLSPTSSGFIPPPPPPPPCMIMEHSPLPPPPPPPNLETLFKQLNSEVENEASFFVRRLTSSEAANNDDASAFSLHPSVSSPAAATISLSSTSTILSSQASDPSDNYRIPSLLDGLRADVAKNEQRASRSVPDLASIEHATSILSSRTGKLNRNRDDRRSRRTDERSDSRKENRADSTRDRRDDRRDNGRRRERERDTGRSSQRTRSRDVTRHRDNDRNDRSRERRTRRNGDRRDEKERERDRDREREDRREKRKEPANDTVVAASSESLRPSDIQLNVREGAQKEGGVQVYLDSDDERDIDGEDEYEEEEDEQEEEEEEGEERVAESDMDIESETDQMDEPDGASISSCHHHGSMVDLNLSAEGGPSSCPPEDEEEYYLMPDVFSASGPLRRVNNPMYKEKYKRARALASQALSEEYRERYDLISKHLRARCIFRGLQSSCGPNAPKLTINDPRPVSKHVQKFPSKESNVHYGHGPDSFIAPSAYKKTTTSGSNYTVAAPGSLTFVSSRKLVRAPVSTSSLKRTIQNGNATSSTSSVVVPSTTVIPSSSSCSSTVSSASSAAAAVDGPTPAKLSKVDEMLSFLLTAPSSPSAGHVAAVDEAPRPRSAFDPAPMRKVASEPMVETMVRSEEALRPLMPALAVHSPRSSATSIMPPRSALSFRKIGEHVVRPGSRLCYEWAESGACKAGVFCNFEHGEGEEAVEKSVCSRMLRGLCRGESSCLLSHGLLPHQMPICEHYLRMQCKHGPEDCGLVHIKHNEKVPVCVFFNQGKCTKEDDCTFRHQYRSDVIRVLGVHAPAPARESRGPRMSRLPKGRALLTAAAAGPSSTTSSAMSSPSRSTATAAVAAVTHEEEDTSTFAWIE